MLTNQDIEKLTRVFPTKDDVRAIVQEELVEIKTSIKDLITGIDKLVKAFEELRREYAAMKEQLDRHERWIKQIAEKSGVALAD